MPETVLAIFAHPDDEVLACGGTLAKHAQAGDRVEVRLLTTGVAQAATPAREAIERRRSEALGRACSVLGAIRLGTGAFPDQRLQEHEAGVLLWIERELALIEPTVIYTHSDSDRNRDHRVVHDLVATAVRGAVNVYAGEVRAQRPPCRPFNPTHFVDISQTINTKVQALLHYQDELRDWPHPRSIHGIETLAKYRGMQVGVTHAEAFEVIREVR